MQWRECKNGVFGFVVVAALLMTSCFSGPEAARLDLPKPKQVPVTQAFVRATVIPMTEPDTVIENCVVIVEDKTIVYVGTDYERIPLTADIVDCSGMWIVPGLADAHIHLLFNALDPLLFLANGVTSVRNMASLTEGGRTDKRFAFSDHLELRDAIRNGQVLSPWIYQASPIHETRKGAYFDRSLYMNTHSAEAGKLAVEMADEAGFDYFKIYNKLGTSAFYSIAEEAKSIGLPVVGHVPHEVPLQAVLEGSLMHSIEHLTGYINPFGELKISPDRLDEIAARTREAGIWNVPTLEVWKHVVRPERIDAIDADRWTGYIPRANRSIWTRSINSFSTLIKKHVEGYEILPSEHIEDFELIVKALIKAKAPIAAGTDSGTLNVVAGSSLHKELGSLVALGMSPWEALASATIRAAECLKAENEFGSIQAGLRADLLVLGGNPLEDVAYLGDIELIVVQGVPYTQQELVSLLDSLVPENNL